MKCTRMIEHAGQQVVLLDYSGLRNPTVILAEIEASKRFIAEHGRTRKMHTLTDVRGARYNAEIMQALKELAAANKPYVERAAVVTNSGLHRVAIMAAATFSRRDLKAFATRDEALDWLTQGVARQTS